MTLMNIDMDARDYYKKNTSTTSTIPTVPGRLSPVETASGPDTVSYTWFFPLYPPTEDDPIGPTPAHDYKGLSQLVLESGSWDSICEIRLGSTGGFYRGMDKHMIDFILSTYYPTDSSSSTDDSSPTHSNPHHDLLPLPRRRIPIFPEFMPLFFHGMGHDYGRVSVTVSYTRPIPESRHGLPPSDLILIVTPIPHDQKTLGIRPNTTTAAAAQGTIRGLYRSFKHPIPYRGGGPCTSPYAWLLNFPKDHAQQGIVDIIFTMTQDPLDAVKVNVKHLGRRNIHDFPYPLGPEIGNHIVVVPSCLSTKPIQRWNTFPLWNILAYQSMYFPRKQDDYFFIFYRLEGEDVETVSPHQLPNHCVYVIEDQVLMYSAGSIKIMPTEWYVT